MIKKQKEVMVPRQDMVAINIDEPVDSYLDDISIHAFQDPGISGRY